MSIGVGLPGGGGRVKKVLVAGAPVPAHKEYVLSTTRDHQRTYDVWVFEGDGATTAECHYLGTVQITGLPGGPKGTVQLGVSFRIDEERMLTVRIREEGSGRSVETLFTTQGTPDEVRRRFDSEVKRAAVGLPPPPGPAAAPASAPAGSPDGSAREGGEDRAAGLKGLWSRITGR
jgi:molecular chaperone DnaK